MSLDNMPDTGGLFGKVQKMLLKAKKASDKMAKKSKAEDIRITYVDGSEVVIPKVNIKAEQAFDTALRKEFDKVDLFGEDSPQKPTKKRKRK